MQFFSRFFSVPVLLVGLSFFLPSAYAQEADLEPPTGEITAQENSWKSITIYSYKRSSGTVTNEHYGATRPV